jgi:geranylgeranyl diphosphate synthase type II
LSALLPAACAVEMVHAYSLVHDDLPAMDDDDLRRGRPTCHKAFDEATAILVGDALLTLAFGVLAEEVRPPEVAARCCAELARAAGAMNMVGGQADDLQLDCAQNPSPSGRGKGEGDPRMESVHLKSPLTSALSPREMETGEAAARLESIHRRKTGAMLRASLRLGGIIGGADLVQLEALDTFGARLGLAFQITDDLLDAAGSESNTGKRVGKDHGRGKLTYPRLFGVEESRRRAAELIDQACAALGAFPSGTERLAALAQYVLERDR